MKESDGKSGFWGAVGRLGAVFLLMGVFETVHHIILNVLNNPNGKWGFLYHTLLDQESAWLFIGIGIVCVFLGILFDRN
ncbi:MAG: hypothetical protein LUH04_16200 [Clostridium sp.]|nr:hypothetical protein [Clostridium sp.]